MPDEKPITLFQSRDAKGTRSIWVTPLPDGRLRIDGQSLELEFWSRIGE
jgi:hypothetical protein